MIPEANLPVADTINKLDDPKEGFQHVVSILSKTDTRHGSHFVIGRVSLNSSASHGVGGSCSGLRKDFKVSTWDGLVRTGSAELNKASAPTTYAPMFTVAMYISLECSVQDDNAPIFERALSWVFCW